MKEFWQGERFMMMGGGQDTCITAVNGGPQEAELKKGQNLHLSRKLPKN